MTDRDVETERLGSSVPQPPQLPPPAARVIADRYALLGELGRGGMGIVWRGEDRVIGRPVAVKEMRLAPDVGPRERDEYEQRILREARTAGRLSDPAVVTVFDVVHADGSIFIVMELVEAPTLAAVIREHGALPPATVAEVGRQVLSALESAHAAGVVHRDVKPSNIMLSASGRAKLTDFGIAQAVDDPTLTQTGMVVGSPAYLAPERLSGREAGPASDLWSLGAVLYYAVEGRGAFERETTAATLNAVINDIPYLTRCQGPLAAAISGMLASAPEGRLSAPQLRSLLTAAAGDGRGVEGLPGVVQTTTLTVRSPAEPLTARLPAAGQPGYPVPPPGADGPRPRRSRAKIYAAIVACSALAIGGLVAGDAAGRSQTKPAYAAVQVFTLGGPTADLPSFTFSSNTCASGPQGLSAKNAYSLVECNQPHDIELYYKENFVDSSFSEYGSTGTGPIPYPDLAQLKVLGQDLCYTYRQISPHADPPGSTYHYAALVPSRDLWNGTKLPSGWSADTSVYCVMWNSGGQQLPADASS